MLRTTLYHKILQPWSNGQISWKKLTKITQEKIINLNSPKFIKEKETVVYLPQVNSMPK